MPESMPRPGPDREDGAAQGSPDRMRVAVGSGVGATIETYDFIGFGTAAAYIC